MANSDYADPTNVPGSEGSDVPIVEATSIDDPATTGVDDDGTSEALGADPLDPATHPLDVPELDDASGLMNEIPDPRDDDVTSDPA